MKNIVKNQLKQRRKKRIRAKVFGTAKRPRLNVFRSLNYITAQVIDDQSGKTLVSASDKDLKTKKAAKTDRAKEVGKEIAKKALAKDIKEVVFDRAGYKYHGRVKILAEAAREAGLKF